MLFFLKKLLQAVFFPPTLFFGLSLLAVLLMRRRRKAGMRLLGGTLLVFMLFCLRPVADLLLGPLERGYPGLESVPSGVTHVVVLGAGIRDPLAPLPGTDLLGLTSLSRLVEGVRLWSRMEGGRLLLSGGNWKKGSQEPSPALVMKRAALLLGVPEDRLIVDSDSRDTGEQARRLVDMLGGEPFVLVTSASHMPRAVRQFRRNGTNPIPAPCDFRTAHRGYRWFDLFPSPLNLQDSCLAVKEYAGLLWALVFH